LSILFISMMQGQANIR